METGCPQKERKHQVEQNLTTDRFFREKIMHFAGVQEIWRQIFKVVKEEGKESQLWREMSFKRNSFSTTFLSLPLQPFNLQVYSSELGAVSGF